MSTDETQLEDEVDDVPASDEVVDEVVDEVLDTDEATEEKVEEKEEPEASLSEELLSAAKDYDLDPTEFVSPQALEKAIARLDRKMSALVQQGDSSKQEVKKEEKKQEDDEDLDLDTFLDPDEYDPKVVKVLKKLDRDNKALKERLQREEADGFTETMDEFFNSLPEDYKSLFGKGTVGEMKETSTERRNRLELVQEMQALAIGDERLGRGKQTLEQLAKRAVRSRFGDEVDQLTRKEVLKKVQKRGQGTAISKPSAKTGKSKDPYAKALAYIEKFEESRGIR